jgi:uncharacterized protein (TIGR00369 family)
VAAVKEETGEFAGWMTWRDEPFEYETAGPFYYRTDEKGPVASFRVARKHMNLGGVAHGGALMAFADFALFALAQDQAGEGLYGVTVAFTAEFIDGAREGEIVEARGDTLKQGGKIIFVRGLATANGRNILNFSGTIMRRKMTP